MAAGLKEKRATVTDHLDLVAEEVERAAKLTAAARQLCQRMAGGHRPTTDERRLFSLLKWSDIDVEREVGRWQTVATWQARAGTNESRSAAESELNGAKADEAKQGPDLDAQIAELTRKRSALANRVTAAQAAVDRNRAACEALRNLSPQQDEVARRRQEIRLKFHAEISDLEGRVRLGRDVPLLDGEGRLLHAGAMEKQGVRLIDRTSTPGGVREEVNLDRWAAYLADRQAELPELESRLADLLARRAADIAEVEKMLDDLIPQ